MMELTGYLRWEPLKLLRAAKQPRDKWIDSYHYAVTDFAGKIKLIARIQYIKDYERATIDGDTTHAMLFRLSRGNWIAGYSLGEGMLFRGELLKGYSVDDATIQARIISEHWIERDREDAELAEMREARGEDDSDSCDD